MLGLAELVTKRLRLRLVSSGRLNDLPTLFYELSARDFR